MFKDNQDFYPTPEPVIRKMLEPYHKESFRVHERFGEHKQEYWSDIASRTILEPSAGKGNILDFLNEKVGVKKNRLYSIEKDPELTYTIQGKGYKVIANDFLDYHGDYNFDFIIANPPFSNGVDHLLKMWEVLYKGDIVCLLNSETIRNPHTQKRKLLKQIIEDHGSYEEIGDCFSDAERTTGVEVCIVRLHKEAKDRFSFDFGSESPDENPFDFNEEIVGNEMAMNDVAGSLIRSYHKSKQAFVNYLKAREELSFFANHLLSDKKYGVKGIFDVVSTALSEGKTKEERYNVFMDEFKLSAWKTILGKLNIEKYLTNSVNKTFQEFAQSTGSMDITKENIYELIMLIVQNRDKIMKDAVVDVFDIFTKFHKENRIHPEGWKTNESWIVGEKIILPYYVEMGYGGYYRENYSRYQEYSDIEKVMCYISGVNYDDVGRAMGKYEYGTKDRDKEFKAVSIRTAIERIPIGSQQWEESEFFYVRCFKKGTLHMKWKSEELRARFNQIACEGKFKIGYSQPKKKRKSKKAA